MYLYPRYISRGVPCIQLQSSVTRSSSRYVGTSWLHEQVGRCASAFAFVRYSVLDVVYFEPEMHTILN